MEPDAAILVWQRNLPRKLNLKARKRQSTRDGAQEAATPLAIALDYVARVGTQCRFHFGRKSPSMIIGRGEP